MDLTAIIVIIGVLVAAAALLFGQGLLRKRAESPQAPAQEPAPEPPKYLLYGIEQISLEIPLSLREEMKAISKYGDNFSVLNVFVKNESNSVCMNPIITLKYLENVFGFVVNDTNEDKAAIEKSVKMPETGVLVLTPKRLGPNSFIDITVWASQTLPIGDWNISFASDGDFTLRKKFISFYSNKEKFV